jgi:hypothetical protein
VLRNDFARYNLTDDESDELDQDDYGWKIISTDVFRFPPHKSLLCAVLGNIIILRLHLSVRASEREVTGSLHRPLC